MASLLQAPARVNKNAAFALALKKAKIDGVATGSSEYDEGKMLAVVTELGEVYGVSVEAILDGIAFFFLKNSTSSKNYQSSQAMFIFRTDNDGGYVHSGFVDVFSRFASALGVTLPALILVRIARSEMLRVPLGEAMTMIANEFKECHSNALKYYAVIVKDKGNRLSSGHGGSGLALMNGGGHVSDVEEGYSY